MSGILNQKAAKKSNIGLRELLDVNEGGLDFVNNRPDNIEHNMVLTSYNVEGRPKEFVFKYLTEFIKPGTGVTIVEVDGVLTLSASGASPLTTKGDIYTYSTTNTRLPVGADGEILYADSSTLTGLKWDAAPTGGGGIQQATASGTDTYTATISGVASYTNGDAYLIRFTNGNTTGCTLNINGLGARTLYRNNDGALIGGDIIDGAEMLCIYNTTLTGFQVIGTAPNTLLAYVTNADSVTITKGQVVYAFGGQGDRMTVKLASNTADATSAQTVGLVLSTSIAANQKGFIMMQGLLDGLSILPTATYSDGDPIYLGATAGSITKIKPYAPNHLVYLGVVTTASNGSAGRMYVKVQNGYELDELHNVQAQTPSLKDTLWYDNTVSPPQWKTASLTSILGYTPVPDTRNITINGTTQNLSADRTWTISSGNVDLSEISVTTSNAREDNYAPTGWPGASTNVTKVIRIETTNTNNITSISGLTSGAAGKTLTIVNSSANGMLILEHESTSSTAANRFSLNQNSTYFLLPNRIITFIYTGSRWTQMTLSNVGGFDLYDEMTNGQQQYTGTHVSNLYNWVTSPNSNAIRSEGAQNEQLGVIGFTTLTSATSSMRAAMGTRTDTGGFITSASPKPVFSLIKLKLPVAPTVAQDFEAFFGFTNSTTTTTTSGGYWWYLPTAASGNTFWQNVSTNNTGSSANIVNTTLAASTITDIYLGVFFTGNTGDCIFIFSTNGITYSIGSKFGYTSGNYEGKPFFGMNKTVGTTARLILVDSAGISYNIRR